ncbi:sporulation protein YpjB [Peribacillus kribbensis]|uniref:sporulation protein YpjB n=1 Tax=Peribacillus kribbensis TaxID=356658 RepID=UPI000416D2F3|nr:sporulation protein YpjB [Peribacillus kribbensis]
MFRVKFLLTAILLVLPVSNVFAEGRSLEKLDQIADEALQLVKSDRIPETASVLKYFSSQFLSMTPKDYPFSMDEQRTITVSQQEALRTVQSTSTPLKDKISAVTTFRLLIDAISSNHQPMWTEMEGRMMETFNSAEEALRKNDREKFEEDFSQLLSEYSLIHPSLQVDIAPEKIQKVDAKFSYMQQYDPLAMEAENTPEEMEALRGDLKSIFEEVKKDETDPSLWWVMISTGSIIILTLSYVGWRKYIGSKESENTRKERND